MVAGKFLSPRGLIILHVAALLSLLLPGHARASLQVQGSPSACASPAIRVRHLATLSDSMESRFTVATRVTGDTNGRMYAAPLSGMGSIAVFEPSGRLLEEIDLSDQLAPNPEILRIRVGPGDSLHVMGWGRHLVLDPDLRVARSAPSRFEPSDIAWLPNGQLVVHAPVFVTDRTVRLLHAIDPAGEVTFSFATLSGSWTPAQLSRQENSWRLALSWGPDGIWASPVNAYRPEHWNGAGYVALQQSRSWFAPWSQQRPNEPLGIPPRPRFLSLHRPDSRFLWTVVAVADAKWRALPGQHINEVDISDVYDVLIELIDVEADRTVRSERLDRVVRFASPSGVLVGQKLTDEGRLRIDMFALDIRGAEPNSHQDGGIDEIHSCVVVGLRADDRYVSGGRAGARVW